MSLNLDKSTWKRVAFGDVIESITDRVDDPSKAGVDRYVGLEHLDPGVLTVERWDTPDKVAAQKLRFQPGDVIFGRRRAYQKKVARADFVGICSAHALVLRAKPDAIDPDFLPVFLASDYFLDRAVSISVGSLSPTVNWRDLKVEEFDLPPLYEQKRIAQTLWAVADTRQALVSERTHLARAKDAWLEAKLRESFSKSHTTLGDLATQGVVTFLTGPFGSTLSAREYVQGGIPIIHPSHIRDDRVTVDSASTVTAEKAAALSRWKVERGDIVLMRKGDVGRSALITSDEAGWILGSDCISVRVNGASDLDPRYLRLALRSPSAMRILLRNAPGTTMPGINEQSLKPIPVPYVDPVVQEKTLMEHESWSFAARALDDEIAGLEALKQTALRDTGEGI